VDKYLFGVSGCLAFGLDCTSGLIYPKTSFWIEISLFIEQSKYNLTSFLSSSTAWVGYEALRL